MSFICYSVWLFSLWCDHLSDFNTWIQCWLSNKETNSVQYLFIQWTIHNICQNRSNSWCYRCKDLTTAFRFNSLFSQRRCSSSWFNLKWFISMLTKFNSSKNVKATNAWGKAGLWWKDKWGFKQRNRYECFTNDNTLQVQISSLHNVTTPSYTTICHWRIKGVDWSNILSFDLPR